MNTQNIQEIKTERDGIDGYAVTIFFTNGTSKTQTITRYQYFELVEWADSNGIALR